MHVHRPVVPSQLLAQVSAHVHVPYWSQPVAHCGHAGGLQLLFASHPVVQ
jgi:hypothetical protein